MSLRNQISVRLPTQIAITTKILCKGDSEPERGMKQELVQPHDYVALRLPSDSTIVVEILPNTYVK